MFIDWVGNKDIFCKFYSTGYPGGENFISNPLKMNALNKPIGTIFLMVIL
jgi:hypothetical protein